MTWWWETSATAKPISATIKAKLPFLFSICSSTLYMIWHFLWQFKTIVIIMSAPSTIMLCSSHSYAIQASPPHQSGLFALLLSLFSIFSFMPHVVAIFVYFCIFLVELFSVNLLHALFLCHDLHLVTNALSPYTNNTSIALLVFYPIYLYSICFLLCVTSCMCF